MQLQWDEKKWQVCFLHYLNKPFSFILHYNKQMHNFTYSKFKIFKTKIKYVKTLFYLSQMKHFP